MIKLQTKIMLLTGLGALALMPEAWAQNWNQKTTFTFSGPVEIPGQILPAGTYVFRLVDSSSNRHIVQVFNKDENRVFGTFLAIPGHRVQTSNQSVIRFEERTAGSPQAIKAWFYPNRHDGHEFVYPKTKALELAKANNTPVPAMPVELTPTITNPTITVKGPEVTALYMAFLKAEEPNGQEVELAEAFPASDTQASAPSAGLPDRLPTTATPLPLIGLIGLLSMGMAATLRLAVARTR
jgi:hypothetical protein